MCVYIAIIATILQLMLWCIDSAPALKYKGYELESWLAGHFNKDSVQWRGRLGMWTKRVVHGVGECRLGIQIF